MLEFSREKEIGRVPRLNRNAKRRAIDLRYVSDVGLIGHEVRDLDLHVRSGERHVARSCGIDGKKRDVPFSRFQSGDQLRNRFVSDELDGHVQPTTQLTTQFHGDAT